MFLSLHKCLNDNQKRIISEFLPEYDLGPVKNWNMFSDKKHGLLVPKEDSPMKCVIFEMDTFEPIDAHNYNFYNKGKLPENIKLVLQKLKSADSDKKEF